jgi:hypothetical protein
MEEGTTQGAAMARWAQSSDGLAGKEQHSHHTFSWGTDSK